jgi:lipopolysaccharide transport system ATP-binding protein
MSNVAIKANGLSKKYQIGNNQPDYNTLRDTLVHAITSPIQQTRRLLRGEAAGNLTKAMWALKDVSFEIQHGEVIGIIGHNGAGKSTLLKILSRITEPTDGVVDLYGRVGSLLEVGTGFHQELTGRENIYLNGAILGMTRKEINSKFDEIVAFAEVEDFIDTPVKHYSSGMGLRLGFAVAAHLEPEILVVDEVLAVGDAAFQRKCLGKMGDVAQEGRTVLFVSHTMATIENLCPRTILLNHGQMVMDGPTEEVIAEYLNEAQLVKTQDLTHAPRPQAHFKHILRSFAMQDDTGLPISSIRCGDPIAFEIGYDAGDLNKNLIFTIQLTSVTGTPLVMFQTRTHYGLVENWPSDGVIRCRVPEMPLLPGPYRINVWCANGRRREDVLDVVENAAELDIISTDYFSTGYLPKMGKQGYFLLHAQWEIPSAEPVLTS